MKRANSLNEFLKLHTFKKEDASPEKQITHTRIGDSKANIHGGSYHIPDSEYQHFMSLLYNNVVSKNAPEYLTEKQLDNAGPIVIDVDFRYDYAVQEKKHSKDHIDDIIFAYLSELEKVYQFDEDTKFEIYVMEKEAVNRIAEKQICKDGIHIIIGLQAEQVVKVHLRNKILEQIGDIWGGLPITNTWPDVFDEGITNGCVNWQLYGCRKPGHEPYTLKYLYKISVDPADGEIVVESDVANAAKLFNETTIQRLSVRYTKHPTLFINPEFAETYATLKGITSASGSASKKANAVGNRLISPSFDHGNLSILSIKSAAELESAVARFLETIDTSDYELRESHDYTMTLPESYYGAGSFTNWIRVGWALRNISDRLFIVWVAFSAKYNRFEYSSITADLWPRWQGFDMNNPNGLTKRSIMHWSKKDAFDAYMQVRHNSVEYYIDLTVDTITVGDSDKHSKGCGDYDIAKVLYQLFKDEYVCVSVKASIWYRYQNHRWREIDSGTSLRKAISEELRKLYSQKAFKLLSQMSSISADDDKYKKMEAKAFKLKNIIARLSQTNDKKNIMTEARELFYDGSFLKKLDVNPYLLCFANGVIDFKEKRFRPGYPEDYLSRCTNLDYIADISNPKYAKMMDEIHDFMNKLFPVAELRKYMWDHLASTLIGTSANQTFNMYIGIGQNGKSVLVNLMEKVLGEYKGDVPLTLVTEKRGKVGGLAPVQLQPEIGREDGRIERVARVREEAGHRQPIDLALGNAGMGQRPAIG
jgi:hypothetical protein